jgi:hypothetical protein
VETSRLQTSDAEHEEGVSRKPSLHAAVFACSRTRSEFSSVKVSAAKFTSARRRTRSPEFRSVPLDAGAIVRCTSTVGDRGYKRTLSQLFVLLYVIHV